MKELLNDLLSTIIFFIVFTIVDDIYVATAAAIGVAIAQFAYQKLVGRTVSRMQWASLGLVIVFGGATLLTQNPKFVMLKPTIIHCAIACVMLQPGWLGRYLPPVAAENLSQRMIVGWGYAWSALMVALGVANVIIALNFEPKVWIWFLSFGAIGAKLVFFAIQYWIFRASVIRQIAARSATTL
ncbi:MAG: septation protein IspZ [Parvibaculum sp.]